MSNTLLATHYLLLNNKMIDTPVILHIETGGAVCSVALSAGNTLLGIKENNEAKAHAQQLSVFIDELLREHQLPYSALDAVAVSKGPGSYTGLRIGTATAKGICYGTGKPLIAIDSLLSLTRVYLQQNAAETGTLYCPMIDARRMEVYTALFDAHTTQLHDTQALIVDDASFANELQNHKIVFFGDGADKCKAVIRHPNACFAHVQASATGMIGDAVKAYAEKRFEDIAYFEPFYLKDFLIVKK